MRRLARAISARIYKVGIKMKHQGKKSSCFAGYVSKGIYKRHLRICDKHQNLVRSYADPGILAREVQVQLPENSFDNFFFFFFFFCCFFWSSTYLFTVLQRGPKDLSMIYFKENYNFPGFREGPTFSKGSNIFPRGFQMLISIETHITCDFPGGGGGPDTLSPS